MPHFLETLEKFEKVLDKGDNKWEAAPVVSASINGEDIDQTEKQRSVS